MVTAEKTRITIFIVPQKKYSLFTEICIYVFEACFSRRDYRAIALFFNAVGAVDKQC